MTSLLRPLQKIEVELTTEIVLKNVAIPLEDSRRSTQTAELRNYWSKEQ